MRRSLPGIALATFLVPSALYSAVFTVNTPIDAADGNPGDGICLIGSLCSLRAAIMEANVLAGGPHIIQVQALTVKLAITSGDDEETFGDLNVLAPMRIEGIGPLATIIEGTGSDRVFDVEAALELSNVTVRGGRAIHPGGGIRVRDGGNLICTRCRLLDNRTTAQGGGLYVEPLGVATLLDSLIAGNASTLDSCGGGITTRGALGVERSHVSQNRAGGDLFNSAFGGGICGHFSSAVSIRNSTLSGNEAADGAGDFGGAIAMLGGTWDLFNVTVSGNRADAGGGIAMLAQSTTELNNVTVAANMAANGGGFYWLPGVTSPLMAANSIFADNTSTGDGPDCSGVIASTSGRILLENTDNCSLSGITTGNKPGVDPLLLPLGSYGGPTPTHELSSTASPAFAAGNNATCESADQRGVARPRGTCEMGATEFVGLVPVGGGTGGVSSPTVFDISPLTGFANLLASDTAVTGTVTSLTSPGAPADVTVTVLDGVADYGTIGSGFAGSCVSAETDCYQVRAQLNGARPGTHWDLTLTEGTAALPLAVPWSLHVSGSYIDLDGLDGPHAIEAALHHGALGECGGRRFCAGNPVTRGQAAVYLERVARGPFYRPPDSAAFSDLAPSDARAPWAEQLVLDGVGEPCGADPDGEGGPLKPPFCPDAPLNRRTAARWLLRAVQAPVPPACVAGSERFADVPASDSACRWVEEMARRLWIAGCSPDPDGAGGPLKPRFCPQNPVARRQLAKLLLLAKDYTLLTF